MFNKTSHKVVKEEFLPSITRPPNWTVNFHFIKCIMRHECNFILSQSSRKAHQSHKNKFSWNHECLHKHWNPFNSWDISDRTKVNQPTYWQIDRFDLIDFLQTIKSYFDNHCCSPEHMCILEVWWICWVHFLHHKAFSKQYFLNSPFFTSMFTTLQSSCVTLLAHCSIRLRVTATCRPLEYCHTIGRTGGPWVWDKQNWHQLTDKTAP